MEEILSFVINEKNIFMKNKLIISTNIRDQYVFYPRLFILNDGSWNENLDIKDYYFENFMNIHVNVYVLCNENIPVFNYSNYTIKPFSEIDNSRHFVVINNNNNIQIHPDILGNGLYELIISDKNDYYISEYQTNNKKNLDIDLFYNFINVQEENEVIIAAFYKSGTNIKNIVQKL